MTQANESNELFGKTVRTVAILVGVCVVFVGVLSVAAVAITNKAVGGTRAEHESQATQQPASPKKSSPQSI